MEEGQPPVREIEESPPDALQVIDEDPPPSGKRLREVEEPVPVPRAWRDALRVIDDDSTPWGKRVKEVEEPAPEEEECGEDEPQDISLPRKRVKLHSDDTLVYWEESEDKILTLASQDTSLVVRDAMASSRDKEDNEDLNLQFVLESRSKHEVKAWHCVCKTINYPKPKLIFGLPKFCCTCQRKFLQENNLDFCLANVRVNMELIVFKIFSQEGPHCIANAFCQAMLMMHTLDCITKSMEMDEAMLHIDPTKLITAYSDEYPLLDEGPQSPVQPSSIHKFIKMALILKNRGIKLKDGSFFQIGDISFIDKNDHEAICEELANGVPLLAVITPGANFKDLKYCQVYRPPLLRDFHECNAYHKQQKHRVHEAHMVVLVGPAFKAKGESSGQAYYFANSHIGWCERKIMDNYHESMPGIKKPVDYGIGKIEAEGLVYSVVKLWKFGEHARPGSVILEDEDEANKYENKPSNRQKFTGQYMADPNS